MCAVMIGSSHSASPDSPCFYPFRTPTGAQIDSDAMIQTQKGVNPGRFYPHNPHLGREKPTKRGPSKNVRGPSASSRRDVVGRTDPPGWPPHRHRIPPPPIHPSRARWRLSPRWHPVNRSDLIQIRPPSPRDPQLRTPPGALAVSWSCVWGGPGGINQDQSPSPTTGAHSLFHPAISQPHVAYRENPSPSRLTCPHPIRPTKTGVPRPLPARAGAGWLSGCLGDWRRPAPAEPDHPYAAAPIPSQA